LNDCPHCGEPVLAHEIAERFCNDKRWYHMECYARQIIGSEAHVEKRCSCFVPGSEEGDDPSLTKREAAHAALNAFRRQERRANNH
jgi:hypothetical protein